MDTKNKSDGTFLNTMNSMYIGGTVAAALVATALITAQFATASVAGPAWAQKTDGSVEQKNSNTATLTITTADDIQRFPDDFVTSNAVVGFAWADSSTGKGFFTTIHPAIGRDSNQNPDAWHAHTGTLVGGTADSDFCLSSIDSTPTSGISIQGNTMKVQTASSNVPSNVDVITGFVINPDSACPVSNLGLSLGVNAVTS